MRTCAGGSTARFDIVVYDSSNAAVTGLVTGNFSKLLTVNGSTDATSVTVTEVANGRYTVTFAAPAVAAGSASYVSCVVLHATHAPRGFQEDFEVYNEVVLAQAVAAIKAKTDLIPASPAAVGSAMTLAAGAVTAAAVATGAIDADALAADAANEIADAILSRDAGEVEDTAAKNSLCGVVLKQTGRFGVGSTTATTYKTDGTEFASQTATKDAGATPVTELGIMT